MFGAGSDTTASAISISIMAAACFPKAQAKVQEELDNVIGKERGECILFYFILSARKKNFFFSFFLCVMYVVWELRKFISIIF